MKKELKSGILSADKSADCRPTVGGVNVIAVLVGPKIAFFRYDDWLYWCSFLRSATSIIIFLTYSIVFLSNNDMFL